MLFLNIFPRHKSLLIKSMISKNLKDTLPQQPHRENGGEGFTLEEMNGIFNLNNFIII